MLCNALGIPLAAGADPQRELLASLGRRDLLLVLDNFEHLIGQAASVAEILRGAPRLRMLVTSRTRLNIRGEQVKDNARRISLLQGTLDMQPVTSDSVAVPLPGAYGLIR